jgi:hypothetical protein
MGCAFAGVLPASGFLGVAFSSFLGAAGLMRAVSVLAGFLALGFCEDLLGVLVGIFVRQS